MEQYSKYSRFHLYMAYVSGDRLNYIYKALYELMVAEEVKPTVPESFAIFRYKYQLEWRMI